MPKYDEFYLVKKNNKKLRKFKTDIIGLHSKFVLNSTENHLITLIKKPDKNNKKGFKKFSGLWRVVVIVVVFERGSYYDQNSINHNGDNY